MWKLFTQDMSGVGPCEGRWTSECGSVLSLVLLRCHQLAHQPLKPRTMLPSPPSERRKWLVHPGTQAEVVVLLIEGPTEA